MTAQEIRQAYIDYFVDRDHAHIARASLIPQEDPTTLFTGSGMQPLIPFLLGEKHTDGNRLVDSQTCLRAQDIEEVGDNRHTTFFEMLGNWSLGDYFKEQQIQWFADFLFNEVELKPENIYVTCFIGSDEHSIDRDDESARVWQQVFSDHGVDGARTAEVGSQSDGDTRGMNDGERIFFYDDGENWWSRAGGLEATPVGDPCGPDSEVFYEFSDVEHTPNMKDAHGDVITGEHCHPACECGRFMEIGNQVFMQYRKTDTGFELLEQPNVDFGGGLERIAAAKLNSPDVFQISLFKPIIDKLEEVSGHTYDDKTEDMRVIADHMRAAMFLAVDGARPSNKGEGYVMRRLIRRAILKAFDLGVENQFVEAVAPEVASAYRDDFPELAANEQEIIGVLLKEEKTFKQTLRKGLRQFEKRTDDGISGDDVFTLYDTYGFPTELSIETARNREVAIADNWSERFDELMEQQRQQSRTASKGQFKGGLGGGDEIHKKYHTATHLMYRALREVLGDHVLQRGSNITDERLRFDFEHPQSMTDEEKVEVERIVNERINMDLNVDFEELPTDEALERGAYGAFGDKYGDTVKVYSMKDDDGKAYSFEICGGPHVNKTSELAKGGKGFKITKEKSSSAGVRRIKAELI